MMNIELTTTKFRSPTWLQGLFILLLALLPLQAAVADEPFDDRAACEINNHPDSTTKCYSQTGNLSFYCSWTSVGRARWYVDNVLTWEDPDLAASGSTFIYTGRASANIYCTWSSIFCGTKASNVAVLTVSEPPAIFTQPLAQTRCAGNSVTFFMNATTKTGTLTYQWKKGSTTLNNVAGKVSGATTSSLTISDLVAADAATYSCVVSNGCDSTSTNGAKLTVKEPVLTFTEQPNSQTTCAGSNVVFSVVFADPTATYQWYSTGPGLLSDGPNVIGAQTATLNLLNVQPSDAAQYYCVTLACNYVFSDFAVLTIESAAPLVTASPVPVAACSGSNVQFTVTATSSGTMSYQWRLGSTDLSNGNGVSGATTRTLTLSGVNNADVGNYTCVVTNTCGSVTSNPAALTINTAPAITTQPVALAQCTGTNASFTVAATGTPSPTFQWKKGSTNLSNIAGQVSGATTATLTLSAIDSSDAASYSCVVTNSCSSVTSNAVALTVNTGPAITTQPVAVAKCAGTNASFTVAATGTPAPTFQWKKGSTNLSNIAGQVSGATTATLTLSAIDSSDAANYSCIVTNSCSSVTSNAVALTVNTGPSITLQPNPLTLCTGNSNATFTVSASGSPAPTYQWQKGTQPLSNLAGQISGATTASLTLTAVDATDAGTYRCVITNSCGTSTSNDAVLVINTGPAITTQPVDAVGCYSLPASFNVAATGTTPAFKWQWLPQGSATWIDLANGSNSYLGSPRLTVTGATASTLQATPLAGAGSLTSFRCVLGNSCSSTNSNPASILLCISDLTCDGMVEDADFSIFIVAYNALDCADPTMPANCPSDLNRDGVVDDADFSIFVVAYDALLCFPAAN